MSSVFREDQMIKRMSKGLCYKNSSLRVTTDPKSINSARRLARAALRVFERARFG